MGKETEREGDTRAARERKNETKSDDNHKIPDEQCVRLRELISEMIRLIQ